MPDKGPSPDDQRGQELGLIPFGEVNRSWEDALRTALKPTDQLLLATDSDKGAGLPSFKGNPDRDKFQVQGKHPVLTQFQELCGGQSTRTRREQEHS